MDLRILISNSLSQNFWVIYLLSFPIFILLLFFFCFLFTGCGSSGPEGVYYVVTNKDNCSFISFSPPNDYHDDFITWTGNKRNGVRNCATKANYIYNKDSKTIIKGDQKIKVISAASILAKVYRDLLMIKLSKKYKNYFWEKNFGYGTKDHLKSLKKYGITTLHRRDFKPVYNMLWLKKFKTQKTSFFT